MWNDHGSVKHLILCSLFAFNLLYLAAHQVEHSDYDGASFIPQFGIGIFLIG